MSRLGMTCLLSCCCLLVGGGLWLLWPGPLPGQMPLLVHTVSVSQDVAAEDQLMVTLSGQGFNSDVRLSLLPDIGNKHLVRGHLPFSGKVNDMVAVGDLLFLANAQDGLVVCDVSRPDVPSVIGSLPLPGMEWRIDVVGSVALVLTIERGLHLVDISDLGEPRLISTLPLNGTAVDMACGKNIVYIAGRENGVYIVDFSDPEHPQLLGAATEPVKAMGVTLVDDQLFVADHLNGFWIYPGMKDGQQGVPEHRAVPGKVQKVLLRNGKLLIRTNDNLFLGSLAGHEPPRALLDPDQFRLTSFEFKGNRIFLGTNHGLVCGQFDAVGDFSMRGLVATLGSAWSIHVVNDWLFLGDGRYGILSFPLDSVDDLSAKPGFVLPDKPAYFEAVDDRLFLASNPSAMQVFEFAEQRELELVGQLYPTLTVSCMAKGAGRFYIGTADRQLITMERKGESLLVRSRQQLPQRAQSLVVHQGVLLVADDFAGILSFGLSDPDHPRNLGGMPSSGITYAMDIAGRSVIIAEGAGGVRLADLLPDGQLHSRQLIRLSQPVIAVAVQDHSILALFRSGMLAYLQLTEQGQMQLISEDIGVPIATQIIAGSGYFYARLTEPSLAVLRPPVKRGDDFEIVERVPLQSSYGSIRLDKQTLLVADMDKGARFFSLVDPARPKAVRTLYPHSRVKDFIPDDEFTLVRHDPWILSLQPVKPETAAPMNMGDFGQRFAIEGNVAFLLTLEQLEIIDFHLPRHLQRLGELRLPAVPRGLTVRGGIAYVAGGDAGLFIIDVSDHRLPVLLGRLKLGDKARSVALTGHFALVADGKAGLAVVDVSDPRSPVLHQQLELASPLNEFSTFYDVKTDGKYVFVADLENGLVIVQVDSGGAARVVGHLQTHGNSWQLCLKDNRVYIADLSGGVLVIDVSKPERPYLVGRIIVPGIAKQVQVVGEELLVLSGAKNLFRLPLPIEATKVVSQGPGRMVARLPRPQASGFYTLRVSGAFGDVEVPGALHIKDGALAQ